MKVYIIAAATIVILTFFMVFQFDNDQYLRDQERLKNVADDCSNIASLYYDGQQYGEGYKIFNKVEGNKAITHILNTNLKMSEEPAQYFTYYFDGNGMMTCYKGVNLAEGEHFVGFPYLFKEELTGYTQLVNEATVVVTIDIGKADYQLAFINDPECIRTSGHEYVAN